MKKRTKVLLLLGILLLVSVAAYPHVGFKCASDDDCIAEYEFCNEKSKCEHRGMLPIRPLEIGGWFVYTITLFCANLSGIAGTLPLIAFISMMNFNMKTGIILSNAQLFSANTARVIIEGSRFHPLRKTHGTLLDYSKVNLMLPMICVGSTIAAAVSRLMPDAVITILYAVILCCILAFNLWRLMKVIAKENKDEEDKKIALE